MKKNLSHFIMEKLFSLGQLKRFFPSVFLALFSVENGSNSVLMLVRVVLDVEWNAGSLRLT